MARQTTRISWVDLNDMVILYEDGGFSAEMLARRYCVRKQRILRLLPLLGAKVRLERETPAVIVQDAESNGASHIFRSRRDAAAFLKIRDIIGKRVDARSSLVFDAESSRIAFAFVTEDDFHGFMESLCLRVGVDDVLLARIEQAWRVLAAIKCNPTSPVTEDGYEPVNLPPQILLQTTLTFPVADLPLIADRW